MLLIRCNVLRDESSVSNLNTTLDSHSNYFSITEILLSGLPNVFNVRIRW